MPGIGTVAAFAAVPIPGADGKIRACVKCEDINKDEQMRWIIKTTCTKGEKLIVWNAKGEGSSEHHLKVDMTSPIDFDVAGSHIRMPTTNTA